MKVSDVVKQVVMQFANQGPGFAQTKPVLAEIERRLGAAGNTLALQQEALTAFHDLFRDGELSWGYDFSNPSEPFFHVSKRSNREI